MRKVTGETHSWAHPHLAEYHRPELQLAWNAAKAVSGKGWSEMLWRTWGRAFRLSDEDLRNRTRVVSYPYVLLYS